jgi:hypothetical protein
VHVMGSVQCLQLSGWHVIRHQIHFRAFQKSQNRPSHNADAGGFKI